MDRLKELFSEIVDVRDSSGKRHCLMHIMVISVCAILCGFNDFEDIADYGNAKKEWFDKYLNLWSGIPSSGTFRNVFRIINPAEFLEIFIKWIYEIIGNKVGRQIIIDGKAIRAAAEKCTNGKAPDMVSAYIADLGISIGQIKVNEKSNEITAIPELLELINIEGCIITIDAMGTQEKIMDTIIKNGGDFVLPVKKNQKKAFHEIEDFFGRSLKGINLKDFLDDTVKSELKEYINEENKKFKIYVKRENGHGREEERIYIKSTEVECLTDKKWKHVKNIVMVISINSEHGSSVKYYVSSKDLPVKEHSKIIRKHWQIENNLHWVLDMYFYEDLSTTRKDYALETLSLLRKMAYNMIKLDKRYDKVNKSGNLIKLSTKRKINKYKLYPQEFDELLFKVIPNISL